MLAVLVSGVAAVGVLTRNDAPPVAAVPPVPAVTDTHVAASDLVTLRDHVEAVSDAGQVRGLRVNDAALAKKLGLEADDVIVALSGRSVTRHSDVADVMLRGATMRVTTLYVELERGTARTLVRWLIDGSLLDARRDHLAAQGPPPGSVPQGTLPSLKNPFTDPDEAAIDSIEQVDDTHVRVPRSSFEALLADPTTAVRGARIVPAMKNGALVGYKLYAIRPNSMFARIGLKNGDTLLAINGEKLAELDDVQMMLVSARRKNTFLLELDRRGAAVTIDVEITK